MTESDEELRRRGVEMPAMLPEPSRFARRCRGRELSEGKQLLGGTLEAAADLGLVGIVLAAPGAVVWVVTRTRRTREAQSVPRRPT